MNNWFRSCSRLVPTVPAPSVVSGGVPISTPCMSTTSGCSLSSSMSSGGEEKGFDPKDAVTSSTKYCFGFINLLNASPNGSTPDSSKSNRSSMSMSADEVVTATTTTTKSDDIETSDINAAMNGNKDLENIVISFSL